MFLAIRIFFIWFSWYWNIYAEEKNQEVLRKIWETPYEGEVTNQVNVTSK